MAIIAAAAMRRDVFAMMLTGLVTVAASDITHRGYPQRRQGRRRRPGKLRRKAGPSGTNGAVPSPLSFARRSTATLDVSHVGRTTP